MEMVKTIPTSDYAALKQIVGEYLPGTDLSELEKMCENFPSAITGYYLDDKLIGVCYGYAIDAENFSLDGIAIIYPYHGSGRGGGLIALFEEKVALLGYKNISLGSADGYVEQFYLKNGYKPTALKIYVEDSEWTDLAKDYPFPVAYTQVEGEYTKLVFEVADYAAMHKAEIVAHYKGSHGFFVFEKKI